MATRPVLADLDLGSVSKLINVPDPVGDQDVANKRYVDAAIEGLAWKDSVRVATQANISLSSPGATIDGISMSANDRVLVRSQSAAAENGIYVWNGAAAAMTRSLDGSTFAELEQAVVTVEEGTSAGASYRQSAINGTIGSSSVTWASFGSGAGAASESTAGVAEIATQAEVDTGTDDARFVTPLKLTNWSGLVRKFSAEFGDGSATSYAINHNLGTRQVVVQVAQNSGTYDVVDVEIEITSTTAVTIKTNSAPASNALRCTVLG